MLPASTQYSLHRAALTHRPIKLGRDEVPDKRDPEVAKVAAVIDDPATT
jgi:hypothetical protein